MYCVLHKDCFFVFFGCFFSMSVCSALCLTVVCLLIALMKTIVKTERWIGKTCCVVCWDGSIVTYAVIFINFVGH